MPRRWATPVPRPSHPGGACRCEALGAEDRIAETERDSIVRRPAQSAAAPATWAILRSGRSAERSNRRSRHTMWRKAPASSSLPGEAITPREQAGSQSRRTSENRGAAERTSFRRPIFGTLAPTRLIEVAPSDPPHRSHGISPWSPGDADESLSDGWSMRNPAELLPAGDRDRAPEKIEDDAAVWFVDAKGGEVRVVGAAATPTWRRARPRTSQGSHEYGRGLLLTESLGRDSRRSRACTRGRAQDDGRRELRLRVRAVGRQGFELLACASVLNRRSRQSRAADEARCPVSSARVRR